MNTENVSNEEKGNDVNHVLAADLRIGNCLYYQGKIIKVDSIADGAINLNDAINDYIKLDDVNPIPLTEEHIKIIPNIKHGSKLSFYCRVYVIDILGIEIEIPWHTEKNKCLICWHPQLSSKINYYHELQNWIHQLTGTDISLIGS